MYNGLVSGYRHTITANHLVRWGKATSTLVCTLIDDRSGMSISADSPSDETLNRGPFALLLRRQYEFPFGIDIVQFSFFFSFFPLSFAINRLLLLQWKSDTSKATEIINSALKVDPLCEYAYEILGTISVQQ